MNKTIRTIIILMVIFSFLAMFPYIIIFSELDEKPEITQDTTIIINNNGKINVKEKLTFPSDENIRYDKVSIRWTLFAKDDKYEDVEELGICKEPENITVYLNNKLLEEYNSIIQRGETTYYKSRAGIVLENVDIIQGKEYQVNINYEYETSDVIEEYSNLSLIKLMSSDNVLESNIRIQLPQKTNKFQLKTKAQIDDLGNNTYNIKGKMKTPYTELLIDNGIIKDAKIINDKYETVDVKRTLNSEELEVINALIIFSIITLVCFITTVVLTKKIKTENNYVRNPEEVIEPILAESIIDRKIGAKELIMSCIVELIYRGNIKNIGNDKVQLINEEYISDYEKEILELIFKEKGQIVTFEEIKEMFKEDNEKTKNLFKKFKVIKKKIEEKLFNYNIYSRIGEIFLKVLKIISTVILFDMAYILYIVLSPFKELVLGNILKYTIIITIMIIITNISKIDFTQIKKKSVKSRVENFRLKISLIAVFISIVTTIYFEGYKHLGTILVMVIIVILNIIILKKSNTHIFTQTGKVEFARSEGLKKYIVDYSLMKERDIESVIIWDEYLAYAVAFGIPNKITDKFDENLMNANIVLQKIEAILKM